MSDFGKKISDLSENKPISYDDLFLVSQPVTATEEHPDGWESRKLTYAGLSSAVSDSLKSTGITSAYVPLSAVTNSLGDSRTKVVSQWLLSTSLGNVQVDLSPLYRILVGQLEFLNRVV